MAKKINTRFVIGLAVGLTILAGGVGFIGWKAITKSGEDYIRLAEKAMSAGDYAKAEQMYSRAVYHEQARVDWREMWIAALLKTTPETMSDYLNEYQKYQSILESLAAIDNRNPQRYYDSLEETYRQMEALGGAQGWQQLQFQADEAIKALRENLGSDESPGVQRIRRFRGLAGLELMIAVDRSQTERDQTLADLKAAYEADPSDTIAAIGIARYHLAEWSRHLRERRSQLAEQEWTKASEYLKGLLETHSDDPRVFLVDLQAKIRRAATQSTNLAESQAALTALAGAQKPLADLLLTLPPERIPSDIVDQFAVANARLGGAEAAEVNHRILSRVLEARPNDDRLLLVRGVMEAGEGKLDEAHATFEKIAGSTWPPVSLEGALLIERRPRALLYMGETSLAKWSTLPDGAEKDAAWARAEDARKRLVDMVPGGASSAPVLQLDGKIAYAQGRYAVAAQKFTELDRLADSKDPEILRVLIQALRQQDQIGAAREKLAQLIEITPGNIPAMMQAAEIDRQLQKNDSATSLLQRVLALDPNNESAKQQLAAIRASTLGVQTNDPVVNAILEAQRMWGQPNVSNETVIAKIEQLARDHPDDIRPWLILIQLAAEVGDAAALQQNVAQALEKFPNDARLKLVSDRLKTQDPMQFALQQIDESDASPAAKEVRKHFLYAQYGQETEAKAALDRAIKLDPDEGAVVEAQFLAAIRAKDIPGARALATKAGSLNIDGVDGLLYQARAELAAERNDVAVSLLRQAVEKAPLLSVLHRYLGEALFRTGRVGEAINAFARAVQLRPSDTTTVRAYLQALIQVGRTHEALQAARQTVHLTRLDSRLNEQWLLLEELVGDRTVALREREGIYRRRPSDRDNLLALVRLNLAQKNWDEAQRLITTAAADKSGRDLTLVALEARLHGLQGQVDAGEATFRDYIASIPADDLASAPYLAMSDYLLEFKGEDAALAALDAGRAHQSAERMEVDRRLGDFFFDRARYEEAAAPYQRIIQGGADSDRHEVAMRYAETLLRLQRWDDADAVLAGLSDNTKDHFRALLLRSEAARGRGDQAQVRRMLDAAVDAAPTNPIPFIRRAVYNASDPTQFNDVMADLEQALALDPASVAARQLRAALLLQRGRVEDAIAEYAAGVKANPDSEELRLALIRQYTSVNRRGDAEAAAQAAVDSDPQNPRWRAIAGDVYAESGKWPRAVEQYRAAYSLDASADVAAKLAGALLSLDPPSANEALSLLEEQGEAANEEGRLLVLRAWALAALDQRDEATRLAVEALAKAHSSADLRAWFRRLPNIVAADSVVSFVDAQTPPQPVKPLYTALKTQLLMGQADRRDALLADLKAASGQTQDPFAVTEVSRSLGMLHYLAGRYPEAADAFARGAAAAPNDFELNNNLAYIRVRYLDDAQGALQPAERAVELSPTNGGVLDTLGWVYHRLGREQQAQDVLRRALDNAAGDEERAPALIHLAETLLTVGDTAGARRRADQAADILRRSQSLNEEYQKELQALMDRLNQAEMTQ